MALKRLSPNASDDETYAAASNFEAGLYQGCTNKVGSKTGRTNITISLNYYILPHLESIYFILCKEIPKYKRSAYSWPEHGRQQCTSAANVTVGFISPKP
jgi:hypothetical protein